MYPSEGFYLALCGKYKQKCLLRGKSSPKCGSAVALMLPHFATFVVLLPEYPTGFYCHPNKQ
ncbi:hypothetical protein C7N43_17700 [Sphingobacteriales bacterium UPWRP_1]|nr:hypothetical protein BVG80_03620 [Sphingobacteriales bacterium TSM_CSM]PSJ75684.1 hypothetical protein C7N43_17700 [Sphingobacteriales bacterium UPWRP_1]